MKTRPRYRRVLLKLTGESLQGAGEGGIDWSAAQRVARELRDVAGLGVQLAIVIGGGNFWRGRTAQNTGMDRIAADQIGMVATVMNGLALRDALEEAGASARVMTSLEIPRFAETFQRDRAIRHLNKGRVVIFAGGTGNPLFTTDTAAALRAAEVRADVLLKASTVDGVYDSDPRKNPKAKRYARLSFSEAIARDLKVMDTAAFSLCKDSGVRIIVFDSRRPGNIKRAVQGRDIGTLVTE
jgi:uridylate kinase